MSKDKTIDRLAVALGLALEEIHNPGAARSAGVDIVALCEGVIKEATKTNGIPEMIKDEIARRTTQDNYPQGRGFDEIY
jgi:hypothetical protein